MLAAVLKELHNAFMLLRRFARRECAQVPVPPEFRILFSRIEPEFTGFEFP
jgi:hypothetical protein